MLDLAPLLGNAVAEVRAAAAGRTLDIAVAVDDAAPRQPCADPHWLRQALAALLSNAVRFTPDGGWIRVAVRAAAGWIEIAVADSGIGIAPEHIGEAFEPFSAAGGDPLLHGSGRFAFGARGLGLGLAMVKGIAEAHGGSIAVESVPDQGSCFTLRLPHGSG
jgi:signal transduction histidine kinase